MSRDNPEGWKAEELFAAVISDLEEKNSYLAQQGSATCSRIMIHNNFMISRLKQCKEAQEGVMEYLSSQLGEDKGPSAPRV
ncbi:conserved hypothetical protein [Vibrio phage 150E35-1]|nr:conserved hypothetical protein [Vibrio phage 150E35-1]